MKAYQIKVANRYRYKVEKILCQFSMNWAYEDGEETGDIESYGIYKFWTGHPMTLTYHCWTTYRVTCNSLKGAVMWTALKTSRVPDFMLKIKAA